MRFDEPKNSLRRRAIQAGRIALERGSYMITLDDWQQAAIAPYGPLTSDERERLKSVSVSDEVIRRVAEDESMPVGNVNSKSRQRNL